MAKLHTMLEPWEPSAGEAWDAVRAAHLLNRAGFGGTEAEISKALELGPKATVDWLMDFPDAPVEEATPDDQPDFTAIEGYPKNPAGVRQLMAGKSREERQQIQQMLAVANRQAINAIINWWMARMVSGPHPLHEKLTFFWHGHFTTSARDERQAMLMWRQHELLRTHAAGNFGTFVKQVSRDPAMLDYLNNNQNRKGSPNENYARELMELFTLGIGNYTENDIKEAARAFTGWAHDGDDFIFRENQHDADEKVFMARRGSFDGDDIINIILQKPECGSYIASRLWNFFAYENPEPDIMASLGTVLKESDYELRPVLRTLFRSRAFYSSRAVGTQIVSPVQMVAGLARKLGVSTGGGGSGGDGKGGGGGGGGGMRSMIQALNQMGQVPLMPPNVKGWPGGRMWINTSTVFVRYNVAIQIVGLSRLASQTPPGLSAKETVDYWLARLIQRPIEDRHKPVLLEALAGKTTDETSLKRMVQLIVSMPEFQLV